MVIGDYMTVKNYCIINSENVCENIILWDGNTDKWQPPLGYTMLLQETTPSKIWGINSNRTDYEMIDSVGDGSIGFTWNGTHLITNEIKPVIENLSQNQPISSGTQTI